MKEITDKLNILWIIRDFLNDLKLNKAVKYIDKKYPELHHLDKKKIKRLKKLPSIGYLLNNFYKNNYYNQDTNLESTQLESIQNEITRHNVNKKDKSDNKRTIHEIESTSNIDKNNNKFNDNILNAKLPKTSSNSIQNRFKRIDEDKYKDKLSDNRLKDNSYWNMKKYSSEADDFASKAAYELGQVRGKGFRHEKAKKKRCSWKGNGTISTGISSIQFSDTD